MASHKADKIHFSCTEWKATGFKRFPATKPRNYSLHDKPVSMRIKLTFYLSRKVRYFGVNFCTILYLDFSVYGPRPLRPLVTSQRHRARRRIPTVMAVDTSDWDVFLNSLVTFKRQNHVHNTCEWHSFCWRVPSFNRSKRRAAFTHNRFFFCLSSVFNPNMWAHTNIANSVKHNQNSFLWNHNKPERIL